MPKKAPVPINPAAADPLDAELPVHLVDDPEHPSRENFDQDKLEELISSIRSVGLTNPISVVVNVERYTTLAGHRRLIACRALGLKTIRARVYPNGTTLAAVVQVHENVIRE